MKKSMKELQEELDKYKRQARSTQDKINDLKAKEYLPLAEEAWVGKCFLYQNSGGGKSWPVYFKVLGISDVMFIGDNYSSIRAKTFSFEEIDDPLEKHGKIFRINTDYDFPIEYLGLEISQKEFDQAWNKMVTRFSSMRKGA